MSSRKDHKAKSKASRPKSAARAKKPAPRSVAKSNGAPLESKARDSAGNNKGASAKVKSKTELPGTQSKAMGKPTSSRPQSAVTGRKPVDALLAHSGGGLGRRGKGRMAAGAAVQVDVGVVAQIVTDRRGNAIAVPDKKRSSGKGEPESMGGGKMNGKLGSAIAARVTSSRASVASMAAKVGEKASSVVVRGSGKAGEAGARGLILPTGYRPTDAEPFMSERQRFYFRNKLIAWKDEIVRQNRETLQGLHEDSAQHADVADRATFETDRALELRARDRQRKLIAKIDAALARIEEGTYGYCEETGEPISLKRLEARPIATLSIEAQERHERRERVFREE